MFKRIMETVIAYIALVLFALHYYQQADFLMLSLIYYRLIKEAK